jgi:DNA polymerase-3 subunit gamma/tau
MSYLVLARKWRPQNWDDLIAQPHVSATLRNAIKHDRLAHGYLFTGPRGVGKTTAARILAKALNCEKGVQPDPCNDCSSCREIAESRNIDVFEIDGASNRGIDEIRSLRENIAYTPARGKFRVYIIDEVHMLTNEAFNALLKTLEEPPDHVIFIFATTEPKKVPATIMSRCQRFDFRRIGTQDINDQLKRICQEEKIDIHEDALLIISRKADGSMRDGESILDQMISYTEGKITVEHVVQALGLIEQEVFFDVSDVLISKNIADGLALVDKVVSGGYDLEEFLIGLTEHLRHLLIVSSTNSAQLLEVSEEHKKKYIETAQSFEEGDLLRLIRIVTDTIVSSKRSINPRLPLETAMVKMIKLDKTVVIEDLLHRIDHFQKNPGTGVNLSDSKAALKTQGKKTGETETKAPSEPVPPKEEDSTSPPAGDEKKKVITLDDVQSKWPKVIEVVKHKKITVGSFIQEGVVLNIQDNDIKIGFGLSNGFHIDSIMRCKNLLVDALKEVFGVALTFHCVKKDLPQRNFVSTSKKEKGEHLKNLEAQNPLIKKIVDNFDAEIVE